MAAGVPQLNAHQITDTTSGKAYFLLVGLSENAQNFEDSTLNIRATDGRICWMKEGMSFFPIWSDRLIGSELRMTRMTPNAHLSRHTDRKCSFSDG